MADRVPWYVQSLASDRAVGAESRIRGVAERAGRPKLMTKRSFLKVGRRIYCLANASDDWEVLLVRIMRRKTNAASFI